jgi:large subunit ribosomal protein L15
MHGFNRHPTLRNFNITVNVSQLADMADGADTLDLAALGIDKILGSGRINVALKVVVGEASAKAVEKIEAAGGSLEMEDGDDEWVEE